MAKKKKQKKKPAKKPKKRRRQKDRHPGAPFVGDCDQSIFA